MMIRIVRALAAAACVVALAACGGGGGITAGATDKTAGSAPNDTQGAPATPARPQMGVKVLSTGQAEVSAISATGGYSAQATLLDAAGRPIVGRKVTFSVSAGAVLVPDSAVTDASGIAWVEIAPSSVSAVGAVTVSATANLEDGEVVGRRDLAITPASLSLGPIAFPPGVEQLPAGTNTTLSVSVFVNDLPAVAVPVNVNFSASCGRLNGRNQPMTVTTNGNGVAVVDYAPLAVDNSFCTGNVALSASTAGVKQGATRNLHIVDPIADAIAFLSATPEQIYVAGSGLPEQSLLRFRVLSRGVPMRNTSVTFQVTPGNPGLALGAAQGLTDQQGEATVTVNSGLQPGPVKVRAALAGNPLVFTETQNLTVASGPPSQQSMSLAVETFNLEGWTVDGSASRLTVYLADRLGNAVTDGTTVNFIAEAGQVGHSCKTLTVNKISSCSVDYISSGDRPVGGRASVLAFTDGEKAYQDLNQSRVYDAGDILADQGAAYLDINESGAWDPAEYSSSPEGAGACPGAGGSAPSRAGTCGPGVHTTVRRQVVFLWSSSKAAIEVIGKNTAGVAFRLRSVENPLLPLPAGSSVLVSTSRSGCKVERLLGSSVPNQPSGFDPSTDLSTEHTLILSDCSASDTVIITVRSPSGLETPFTVPLS